MNDVRFSIFDFRFSINKSALLLTMAVVGGGVLGGCSALDLGPQPSNYVGPGGLMHQKPDGTYPAIALPDHASAVTTTEPAATAGYMTSIEPVTQPATAPAATLPASATAPTSATAPAPATVPAGNVSEQPNGGGAKNENPMPLSVEGAILTALEHNPNLNVQRLNPLIRRTFEEQQRAAFDPTINSEVSAGKSKFPSGTNLDPATGLPRITTNETINGAVSASQFLPTGTTINLSGSTDYARSIFFTDDPSQIHTRYGVTLTQALLRGASVSANLAALRESQLDTKISQYELRGFAETLVSSVEGAYWDHALAQRQIDIFTASLKIAQDQLAQTNEFIRVGRLAEIERAASEAEVAQRQVDLINANANLETTRLALLQLLNPVDGRTTKAMGPNDPKWSRPITIMTPVFIPNTVLDPVQAHVDVALILRPDLNQTRLLIQRGDLEVVRTKNGLLPKLDLFVTLGKSGFSKSFGGSYENLNGPSYDALVGVRFEYPPVNRDAQAQYRRAVLDKDQSQSALDNQLLLAQVDVRSAYVDVERLKQQIVATATTSRFREEALRAEMEKFRVGRSTTLLVAQAQRDLVQAQIGEVQAQAGYLKALINLYSQEGTLLLRRGLQAPGQMPVVAQNGVVKK